MVNKALFYGSQKRIKLPSYGTPRITLRSNELAPRVSLFVDSNSTPVLNAPALFQRTPDVEPVRKHKYVKRVRRVVEGYRENIAPSIFEGNPQHEYQEAMARREAAGMLFNKLKDWSEKSKFSKNVKTGLKNVLFKKGKKGSENE